MLMPKNNYHGKVLSIYRILYFIAHLVDLLCWLSVITGIHLTTPQVSTAFIDCEAIRQKKQRSDPTHLWSASAGTFCFPLFWSRLPPQ
jgi:hypothetical protein